MKVESSQIVIKKVSTTDGTEVIVQPGPRKDFQKTETISLILPEQLHGSPSEFEITFRDGDVFRDRLAVFKYFGPGRKPVYIEVKGL